MTLFAQYQPIYAKHGIATFPVTILNGDKKPAVKGYLDLTLDESRKLALKFEGHEAFGFALGAQSGITVLDVDTPDEQALRDALAKHGPTPIIVQSGRGHWHAWYRHNGEGRHIRPWGNDAPIDVLGGGFVVAPPSMGVRGPYEFVKGGLDDLANLPTLKNLDLPESKPRSPKATGSTVYEGQRNSTLFKACLRCALDCSSLDELLTWAQAYNSDTMCAPLPDEEVLAVARQVWDYTVNGSNWAACPVVPLPYTDIDELDADELFLLTFIRRWHGARENFALPNSIRSKLGWTEHRFIKVRNALVKRKRIKCVSPWTSTKPGIYALTGYCKIDRATAPKGTAKSQGQGTAKSTGQGTAKSTDNIINTPLSPLSSGLEVSGLSDRTQYDRMREADGVPPRADQDWNDLEIPELSDDDVPEIRSDCRASRAAELENKLQVARMTYDETAADEAEAYRRAKGI
jgi:Bifunctional DNA primase/polymerase, N-terminal